MTSKRPTAELIEVLEAAGVPCAPISDYGEVFADEHLDQRGFFWDALHPTMGPVRQIGSPMPFSRTSARRDCAGPLLGSGTRAVLEAAGLSAPDVAELLASGVAAAAAFVPAKPPQIPETSPQPRTD